MDIDYKVRISILLDYYGNLLTESCYSMLLDRYYNDLSLAEIADRAGITRQGVRDSLLRGEKQLLDYEDKLQLKEKSDMTISKLKEILILSNQAEISGMIEDMISSMEEN